MALYCTMWHHIHHMARRLSQWWAADTSRVVTLRKPCSCNRHQENVVLRHQKKRLSGCAFWEEEGLLAHCAVAQQTRLPPGFVYFSRTSDGLLMDFWWTSHGLLMDFLWFTDEGIRTPKQHKKNWAAHPNSLCQHDCIPSGCQALNLRVCFQSQRSHSLGVMLDLDLLRVP